jgi:SNF2 family DNA or RNA helicase
MVMTWQREIKKWENGRKKEWDVLNYDKLLNKAVLKELVGKRYSVLICDESHQALKNGKTERAKTIVRKLIPLSERVWLSTATPASVGAEDYYVTLKVLLPTLMENWSLTDFKKEFCQEVPNRWARTGVSYQGFKNTDVLNKILSKCSLKRKQEEVLPELPSKRYQDTEIEGGPEEDDWEEFESFLETGVQIPAHYSAKLIRNSLEKVQAVVDLVSSYPPEESLVVYCWHKEVVAALYDAVTGMSGGGAVSGRVEVINGDTGTSDRQKIVDDFQKGEVRVLILNYLSGGVGITLTRARTSIFVEFPGSPSILEQAEKRIHRIGSTGESVQFIRVIRGELDRRVFERLDERRAGMSEVGV